jgi:hypothetical protein
MKQFFPLFLLLCVACAAPRNPQPTSEGEPAPIARPFRGGIVEDARAAAAAPRPVRNDVAQPGEEIVTIRYFKIKKGSFPEFYRASEEGVWPYFEKIGSRVIGMWQVIHPEGTDSEPNPDYDEVYLSTRYASFEHWAATREMARLGGNGPDWEKCRAALAQRQALTIESRVIFLKGSMAPGGPYFMPGLDEAYEKK